MEQGASTGPRASPDATRAFSPSPASVPAARRFVREVLLGAGQERWVDDAMLAVSELATNVVLHVHTPFTVTVRTTRDGVLVQVWDDDPVLPARRRTDTGSTTGRGMELVEAVSTTSGVQSVGPVKVVWFCLGTVRLDEDDDALLDRWSDRGEARPAPTGRSRTVVLHGMPTALWLAAREHHNTLMREYALHEQSQGRLPERLIAADRARSIVLAALRASPGGAAVDLPLQVRPEQGAWFGALLEVLDAAEALALVGALLASPGPQPFIDVRRWAAGQVLAQLDGEAPTPWRGPLHLAPAG